MLDAVFDETINTHTNTEVWCLLSWSDRGSVWHVRHFSRCGVNISGTIDGSEGMMHASLLCIFCTVLIGLVQTQQCVLSFRIYASHRSIPACSRLRWLHQKAPQSFNVCTGCSHWNKCWRCTLLHGEIVFMLKLLLQLGLGSWVGLEKTSCFGLRYLFWSP